MEGHAGEELEQSLERVSVGVGEKEAEQTQRVPSLSGAGQLCKRGKEGEGREGEGEKGVTQMQVQCIQLKQGQDHPPTGGP